jgi:signal transduction histidine kinase/ActR/RegA family two-component response regulator
MRPTTPGVMVKQDSTKEQILPAQLSLLYANTNLGVAVNILAAAVLGALQWGIVSRPVVIGWWLYVGLASIVRYAIARRWHALPKRSDLSGWRTTFAVGIGLAGAGWGAAGILLFPAGHLANQLFLIFVLGGMMLGASLLLAPRPEAFLAFLIPTGLGPAIRLSLEGDKTHLAMGLLAAVFTLAILITTGRIYRMVETSLRLQIENRDLVEDLRSANQETAAANQALELRVQDRTAELHHSTEQLLAEIAHREQAEEELLRARKLESLGVLAGGIAHDFNNFLTVVQGNLAVAKTQLKEQDAAQEFLDQAASACLRAKSLSSQLLTFAKGGAPVRRVVSIAELVTDAVQLARTGSPVGIEVTIDEDLWSAKVDPGQIGQVLHNILLNARQAMPGGGTIKVHAGNIGSQDRPEEAHRRVRISIRDHGRGISAEVLRRIFDPYFTTKPGGAGLGLATAYAIVLKHGGHIAAESAPEAGTVFTVDLPATLETPLAETFSGASIQTGTERLLVMDDEETLRTLFQAVLSQLGYVVQTASDGAEAVALYQAARAVGAGFDAVLLDLTVIGGMGGMEAAAKLKQLDPDAKLIVSSGYSDAPVMSHFSDYGFDAVILKPWTVKEMSDVLRQVLVENPAIRERS